MKLVLVRHGESDWNKLNLFTGWTDVDLSQTGHREAIQAGTILKNEGYEFDVCYTSYLKGAIHTWNIDSALLPAGESLKTTIERVIPYFNETVKKDMQAGKRALIVAHGNSLRALVKYFDKLSNEAIMNINIPTGIPLVYEFDDEFKVIKHYYLGDETLLKEKIDAVADQGKKLVVTV